MALALNPESLGYFPPNACGKKPARHTGRDAVIFARAVLFLWDRIRTVEAGLIPWFPFFFKHESKAVTCGVRPSLLTYCQVKYSVTPPQRCSATFQGRSLSRMGITFKYRHPPRDQVLPLRRKSIFSLGPGII
jgi:hypothetical protein